MQNNFSDFDIFGVKRSALVRIRQKNLDQNIYPRLPKLWILSTCFNLTPKTLKSFIIFISFKVGLIFKMSSAQSVNDI